jgi:hypothetical protein
VSREREVEGGRERESAREREGEREGKRRERGRESEKDQKRVIERGRDKIERERKSARARERERERDYTDAVPLRGSWCNLLRDSRVAYFLSHFSLNFHVSLNFLVHFSLNFLLHVSLNCSFLSVTLFIQLY